MFAVLAAAPTLVYLATTNGVFAAQTADKVHPSLWWDSFFWRNWPARVVNALGSAGSTPGKAAGIVVATVAVLGGLRLDGRARALVLGVVAGYVLFALAFAYNVATHTYYQLPLVPIAALCLGSAGEWLVDRIGESQHEWLLGAVCIAAIATALAVLIPRERRPPPFAAPATPQSSNKPELEVRRFEEIGRLVSHTTRALFLDSGDGLALEYYGRFAGVNWPKSTDYRLERLSDQPPIPIAQRFRNKSPSRAPNTSLLDGPPEYFVVTDLPDFHRQDELQDFLKLHAHSLARTSEYMIYRLSPPFRAQ